MTLRSHNQPGALPRPKFSFRTLKCLGAATVCALATAAIPPVSGAANATAALGFARSTVISGLTKPTAVAFANDGRIFIAESSGLIKIFTNLTDTAPRIFADLRTEVFSANGPGLLGLTLDPNFPANPYVYVAYLRDSNTLGGAVPFYNDVCPAPASGCISYGRVARLTASGDHQTGSSLTLVDGWCTQFNSHTMGALRFGADGMLYISSGDGADYRHADYGQNGSPRNPCGDPPGGIGATMTAPASEGGSLRAQDVRTDGDPAGYSGTVLRVDPATGQAAPGNPYVSNVDANKRRVLAFGFRNAFRMAFRPGTNDLWLTENGLDTTDEINRIPDTTASLSSNFGWPCFEGANAQSLFAPMNFSLCTSLQMNQTRLPVFGYDHGSPFVAGETCPNTVGSPTGLAFAPPNRYPSQFRNSVFVIDYARACLWSIPVDSAGNPNVAARSMVLNLAGDGPTDLAVGPRGDMYYVDNKNGTLVDVTYTPSMNALFAVQNPISAAPGLTPISGDFNGDGFADVLLYGPGSAPDSIAYGNDRASFAVVPVGPVNGHYTPITGDFNGDGKSDVLLYGYGKARDYLLMGSPQGLTPGAHVSINGKYRPVSGDFNGDGRADILWYGYGTVVDHLWSGTPSGFGSSVIAINGKYSPFAGDFNGDGISDVFWYGVGHLVDHVRLGSPSGFVAGQRVTVNGNYLPSVGDFNRDGKSDIIWRSPAALTQGLWLGGASFTNGAALAMPGGLVPVVGDYLGDGGSDIVWYDANGASPYWTSL